MHMGEEELDAYWDALVLGDQPSPAASHDSPARNRLRALHDLAHAPTPAGAKERARQQLPARLSAGNNGTHALNGHENIASVFSANGHAVPSWQASNTPNVASDRERPDWWLPVMAAAALVLLSLGVGYIAVRSIWPEREARNTIPAVSAPAPVTETSLFDLAIPADDVPHGARVAVGLTHITIPAGDHSEWAGNCCPELRIYYVVRGALTVRPLGPMHVVEAGETNGVSAAIGEEIVIHPGDALIAENSVPFEYSNPGMITFEMLMAEVTSQQNGVLPGWIQHAFSGSSEIDMAPGEAVILHLRQVDLLPGAAMPAQPQALGQVAMSLFTTPDGALDSRSIVKQPDGSILNDSQSTLVVQVLTIESTGEPIDSSATNASSPDEAGP
jgi:hypothetical protein